MTVLATVKHPFFEVSRMEIDRLGPTYTIDTIRELTKSNPNSKIYFITGADAVHEILSWKDAEQLLSLCSFVAVTRPGYHTEHLRSEIARLKENNKSRIHFLEVPALAISSSDIRMRVLQGQPIRYLVPEEVEIYINKAGIYHSNPSMPDPDDILGILKKKLTTKRLAHTQGTADEAVRLAQCHGGDPYKAYITALLHDCAKDYSQDEKKKLCKKYGIKIDNIMKRQMDLTHSFIGGSMAKKDFGITDQDMLSAICYHTTGRKNMSLLEKIIYVADCIEPNREPYPGLADIRTAAYTDLDKAIRISLQNTIRYNKDKKRLIHPLSIEALEWLENIPKKKNAITEG